MKTQLIGILLATVFSSTVFAADDQSPVEVKGSGSAIGAGFENWAKDNLKYGGSGGQIIAAEVQAWIKESKKIGRI